VSSGKDDIERVVGADLIEEPERTVQQGSEGEALVREIGEGGERMRHLSPLDAAHVDHPAESGVCVGLEVSRHDDRAVLAQLFRDRLSARVIQEELDRRGCVEDDQRAVLVRPRPATSARCAARSSRASRTAWAALIPGRTGIR
jgi:hypothetical protein